MEQANALKANIVVTVERATVSDSSKVASSFMVARLLWYFRLTRFLGCLFVSNLNEKSMKDAVATWKSPYTAYAGLWFSTFLGYKVLELDVHIFLRRCAQEVSPILEVRISFGRCREGLRKLHVLLPPIQRLPRLRAERDSI
ncbi:hypothetical protein MRX96_044528 [Rhipicephalus microplus]